MTLLEALKSSDLKTQTDAFVSLKQWVYPIVHRRLANSFPQWIDEAVAEAMGKVFEDVDKIKSDQVLERITQRVAMHCAVSSWRKFMAKKRGENKVQSTDQLREECGDGYLTSDLAPKGHVEDAFAGPLVPGIHSCHLDNFDSKDILDILETLEAELKPEYKQALNDFFILGLSHEEIALKRGWPKGSVGVYVKRGLDAMRKQRLKYPQLTQEAMRYIMMMLA